MAVEAGKWAAEWDRAKKAFEKNTKEKKPSETFLKISLGSGIGSKLKTMDTAFDNYVKAKGKTETERVATKAKYLKELDKATKDAKKSVDAYIKILNKAWADELKKTGSKMKLDSINVLEKDLDAIIESAEARVKFDAGLLGKKGDELKAAARDLGALIKNLDATLKKGALFAAQCQRNTNGDVAEAIAFFQDNIQDAARDINQNVGNIAKQYDATSAEAKEGTSLFKEISPWASNAKSQSEIKNMKTMKDVIANTKTYTDWVKKVAGWRKGLKVA
ncbi:hypothetical protein [Arenibacterium sp. LLYu02]|uniref:hypothetical protein n=1 Tax=Arenibacterium sp. LLYu02 TaxID=3404132 RepID=UPI003B220A64